PILFAEQIVEFLSSDGPAHGPLQVRELFDQAKMPKETCTAQLPLFPGYPKIPGRLLKNGDAETRLFEQANLGGRFKNNKAAGQYSLRLHDDLRNVVKNVVKQGDASIALAHSAEFYYRGDTVWGQYLAELSVTGRRAYESFRSKPSANIAPEVRKIIGTAIDGHKPDESKLQVAIHNALTRAYQVAWALRDPDGNRP